ncbi:protein kinase [Yoonia sp.]|uniref:serine/threonine protein kinase n=1 Tax=Yoonia sp. TaxID=2212373 RepID=UPI0025D40843|nr:protein kinase [Yoonia sp.]
MDKVKAQELYEKLSGKEINGWCVEELINFGKSAAVFKAKKSATGESGALKVFDDELIEKYGDHAQIARIERELSLVGKSHPNMVKILAGGVDAITGNHFLLMEFLDGPNLKQCLGDIPIGSVGDLVSQLSSCCEFLESLGLTHRDIKPENIVIIEDFSRLILLDFGVLRPVGDGGITDGDGVQSFVGTLQYSSPEFLLRNEEDSVEGWRALTFYQIGAVMHDLIMRKEIFSESAEPYARLVMAVQNDTPTIHNGSLPNYLIETARLCLSKDPKVRVELLSWASFAPPADSGEALSAMKKRVAARSHMVEGLKADDQDTAEITNALLEDVISHLKVKVRSIRNSNRSAVPPVVITRKHNTVCIFFKRSNEHALLCDVKILLKIEVIDPAIGAIQLVASPFFCEHQDFKDAHDHVVYRGISAGDNIVATLENCIYSAIDQAQQWSPDNDKSLISFKEICIED